MSTKIIKLGKKDDIASVVRQIKDLQEPDVIFELEKGSILLKSSDNLKMMRRTGEVLGKNIRVITDDETGKLLAKKAGVLFSDAEAKPLKTTVRVARSDVKPRFSDIMARPHVVSKMAAKVQKAFEPVRSASVSISKPKVSFKWPSFKIGKILIPALAAIVVIFLLLAIFLPRADVTVFARSEPITRDMEIAVDKSTTTVDAAKLSIPGIAVAKDISQTKNFPATGTSSVGTKASGSVVIYNFTKNTLTLKAATTTLVVDGKKFVFTKDATGLKGTGSIPSAPMAIMAEAAGDGYNIPPNTRFQIVNAALGNQNVYATNPQALSGGASKPGTTVSQDDLDKATQTLTDAVLSQAETDVSGEVGSLIKLIPSGVTEEILAHTANKNVGAEADSFDMTLIAKVTGLGFKEADVTSVVIEKINEVLSSDKYLDPNAKQTYSAKFKSFDLTKGSGVLAVHFETVAAYKVDSSNLAKILSGKTENEIKEILLSKPEIDNVTVKFWPSWFVHKAPRLSSRINVKTVLSQAQ